MIIRSIGETSYSGMFKVETEQTKFYVRQEYLPSIQLNFLEPGIEFTNEKADELLDAGLTSVVELKAVEYLSRAEQSRFGLTRKLLEKQYEKKFIDNALTFLETKNFLSDARFSRAWLNSRKINHYEGRTKLLSELLSRGISKEVASTAIEDFFTENSEEEIFKKAYERFVRKGKKDEKLVQALLQAGFSYKLIKNGEVQ